MKKIIKKVKSKFCKHEWYYIGKTIEIVHFGGIHREITHKFICRKCGKLDKVLESFNRL